MHNSITSIPEVARLSQLRVLKCSFNQIADLSWVARLQELRELWAHHNLIEIPQIAHLQTLTQLQTIVLHPNPCTELSSYILDVARALPWLDRLDTVIVDQELRAEAQHTNERDALSTGSTEHSLLSLSGRPDAPEEPPPQPPPPSQQPAKPQTKKGKQLLAEEFMRNFPVQGYIPVSNEDVHNGCDSQTDADSPPTNEHAAPPLSSEPGSFVSIQSVHDDAEHLATSPMPVGAADAESAAPLPSPAKSSPVKTISSIASAVLSLPTFSSDGFLKKHAPKPTSSTAKKKIALRAKSDETSVQAMPDSSSFQQDDWSVGYPNTGATAIHIRADGSAVAKWLNGAIAVSVDRERDGFRVYAAHKDGQIALSFDASGVGFINYYPSGKVMVSTTSSGDGLYFSSKGFAIARQWDAELNFRDEHMEPTTALGNGPDGALLCKLSDGIDIRLQLGDGAASVKNPIQLIVHFAGAGGVRHVFRNHINIAAAVPDDACDCVFGEELAVGRTTKKQKEKPVPHAELLSGIRAAVAHLLP